MRVGIIGSSHSTGNHKLDNGSVTPKFLDVIQELDPANEYISCAHPGKGSEMFLNAVVHLKDRYAVDAILIELIHNRRNINCDVSKEDDSFYHEIDSKKYQHSLQSASTAQELADNTFTYNNLYNYKNFISCEDQFFNLKLVGDTLIKKQLAWRDIQLSIASVESMVDFWTVQDIYQTVKLCSMLNIKTVVWQNSVIFDFDTPVKEMDRIAQTFYNDIDCFVRFDEFTASKRYFTHHLGKDITCDAAHIKPELERQMLEQFIIPSIHGIQDTNPVC